MLKFHKVAAGAGVLFLSLCFLAVLPAAAAEGREPGPNQTAKNDAGERVSYHRYSNLSELVTLICDDAGAAFRGFYGPAAVEVTPFAVVSDYRVRKMTRLGLTLADQMAAMINREPGAPAMAGAHSPQTMEGVIEEVDGFLRVHISGSNILGERRAHVVNVEMSEPIYRFLHSYVESYQNN
jgi:hypothetical protein